MNDETLERLNEAMRQNSGGIYTGTGPDGFKVHMREIGNGFVVVDKEMERELYAKNLEEAARHFISLYAARQLDK